MGKRKKEAVVSRVEIKPYGADPKKVTLLCGVYEIVHEATKRRYVGSSFEIEKRVYLHIVTLRMGKHHCKYLQNVFTKYGEKGFKFYLIETCKREDLLIREQFHMDIKSEYSLMNTHPAAGSGYGFKFSEETKAKMSAHAKVWGNTKEQKRIRSERAKLQHATGRIGYRKRIDRPRVCKNCNEQFIPPRIPNGQPSATKWCDKCRPPHHGGYYKTTTALKAGVSKQYTRKGMPKGFKHTEATRKSISKAAKAMWKKIKAGKLKHRKYYGA